MCLIGAEFTGQIVPFTHTHRTIQLDRGWPRLAEVTVRALSVAKLLGSDCRAVNDLQRVWKEAVVASSRFYYGICLKGLRKHNKTWQSGQSVVWSRFEPKSSRAKVWSIIPKLPCSALQLCHHFCSILGKLQVRIRAFGPISLLTVLVGLPGTFHNNAQIHRTCFCCINPSYLIVCHYKHMQLRVCR